MAEPNTKQILRNREVARDSALESSWNADFENSVDADWPEGVFESRPTDRVGYLPNNKPKDR
jgi:hypothetical protein